MRLKVSPRGCVRADRASEHAIRNLARGRAYRMDVALEQRSGGAARGVCQAHDTAVVGFVGVNRSAVGKGLKFEFKTEI